MKLRRWLWRTTIFLLVLYVAIFVFINFVRPLNYIECEMYTEEMNGGIHSFNGTNYRIELCGIRGRIDPGNVRNDEIRLRVFSMNGELLAERFFEPLLGMGDFGLHLKYNQNSLSYERRDQGPTQKLPIPPSRLDWLRARLPRMWP